MKFLSATLVEMISPHRGSEPAKALHSAAARFSQGRFRSLLITICFVLGACAYTDPPKVGKSPPASHSASTDAPAPAAPEPRVPATEGASTHAPSEVTPEPTAAVPATETVSTAVDVHFYTGQAILSPDERARLDEFVARLRDIRPNVVFAIGHTDSTGSDVYNERLSIRRAEAVKSYLVSKGIPPNLIYTEGRGKRQPIADNNTSEGRAENNRVALELTGTRFAGDPRFVVIPIFYATNRLKTGRNDPADYFTNEEAKSKRLTLGLVQVSVPPGHVRGRVEGPAPWGVPYLKWEWYGVFFKGKLDPSLHFAFSSPVEELTEKDFRASLKRSIAESGGRAALLYVHGFNNSFADAAYRTAQLTFDLRADGYDLVPVMFSWPSDKVLYSAAKDQMRAASAQLASLLTAITTNTDVGVVHVVAHSMGTEVLSESFRRLGNNVLTTRRNGGRGPRFNHVILAAADIRASDFQEMIAPAVASGHRVTSYASSNDLVLLASKQANAGPRAGDSGENMVLVKGVETIDASKVNDSVSLRHSFFAESPYMLHDMLTLLKFDAKPGERGLEPVRRGDVTYWRFR